MSARELRDRADANYLETFRLLARTIEGGEIIEFGGVTIAATGLPLRPFNVAFMRRSSANSTAELAHAVSWLRSRGQPFLVRYCVPVEPATFESAMALGLARIEEQPGMMLPNSLPAPKPDPGIEIVTVGTEADLQSHADVCAKSFGAPTEAVRRLFGPGMLSLSDTEFYVCYVDGEPVASSALFASHGVAGIYNVATIPSHRRMGLGAAMTWHAVRNGRRMACRFSCLQASPMGKPVYARMGFEVVKSYFSFAWDHQQLEADV